MLCIPIVGTRQVMPTSVAGSAHDHLGPNHDMRYTIEAWHRYNARHQLGESHDMRHTLNTRGCNIVGVPNFDGEDDCHPKRRGRGYPTAPFEILYAGPRAFGPRVLNATFPYRLRVNGIERYTG